MSNGGHGYVFPRDDGIKARCGGPALCAECAKDLARARELECSAVTGGDPRNILRRFREVWAMPYVVLP